MTTGFILVPSIIANITAIVQMINFWESIMAVLHLSIVVRYIETIISPHSPVAKWSETTSSDPPVTRESETTSLDRPVIRQSETTSLYRSVPRQSETTSPDRSVTGRRETTSPYRSVTRWSETTSPDCLITTRSKATSPDPPVTRRSETTSSDRCRIYFLAQLRYVETITKSAPQLCLQVYIMLRQWYFPTYTMVSSVLSFLSLAWSITTLEKEKNIKEGRDFGWKVTVLFLIWQLLALVSRLSAIVLFSYVFHYHVIVFLAAHWFILAGNMCGIKLFSDGSDSPEKSSVLSFLAAYPSLFHSSTPVLLTRRPKFEMTLVYTLLLVENIIMVTLSLTTEMPDTPHFDGLRIFAILIFTVATIVSFIYFIFCYIRMDFTSSSAEIIRTTQMAMREYGQRNYAWHDITEEHDTYF